MSNEPGTVSPETPCFTKAYAMGIKKRIRLFVFPPAFVVTLCLFVVDAVVLCRLGLYGQRAHATITEVDASRHGSKTGRFADGDKIVRKITLKKHEGGPPVVGAKVEIVYLPGRPEIYRVSGRGRYAMLICTAVLATLLGLVTCADWMDRRSPARRA